MTDTDLDAGLGHRGERRAGFLSGRRQRLLAEDVTAGPRCRDYLLGVQTVRGAEDDCLDLVVGERLVEGGGGADAERGHGVARPRLDVDREHDPCVVTALQVPDDLVPPPAKADHR